MNKQEARRLVIFCLDNGIPFEYQTKGEYHAIVIPHGQPLSRLMGALTGENKLIAVPSIVTISDGLRIK